MSNLVVRRARALLSSISKRTEEAQEAYRKYKAGKGGYASTNKVPVSDFFGEINSLDDALKKLDGVGESPGSIPFTTEKVPGVGAGSTDIRERHESFGVVQISRQSNGGRRRLFGSHLSSHPISYKLTIYRAERLHSDLSYDRFYPLEGVGKSQIIEMELSPSQLTDVFTNMNIGVGIPCTLRRVSGVQMEAVPDEHVPERERIRDRFRSEMSDVAGTVKPLTDEISEILVKKSIGKKDRGNISSLVGRIVRKFTDTAAFTLDQFGESVNKLESSARAEIEAYAESVIHAAGIEHLRELKAADPKRAQGVLDAIDVESSNRNNGEECD